MPRNLRFGLENGSTIRLLMRQTVDAALELLFPPRCIRCKRVGSLFCATCQAAIPIPPVLKNAECLQEIRAGALYDGAIRDAIRAFKYDNRHRLAAVLGERLHQAYVHSGWTATLLTAVPLHPKRFRHRGYNQSALLAAELARRCRLPFNADALHRVRDTPPQVGLNVAQRWKNVTDAFEAEPTIVESQHIVIIDDVCTTGATLNACAEALLLAGATSVRGLTVATVGPEPALDHA
jgi:ComF family protein